jgi:hypothetical protein
MSAYSMVSSAHSVEEVPDLTTPTLRPISVPAPDAGLPLRRVAAAELTIPWWWVGVHGGAGESTLEQLYVGTRGGGHCWPVAEVGRPAVVLVARTHARGLLAVQAAVRDLSYRRVAVHLLGVLLIADAPGRLPRALRELADRVVGTALVPRSWLLPFVAEWRVGETPSRANSPKEALWLLEELNGARDREAGS